MSKYDNGGPAFPTPDVVDFPDSPGLCTAGNDGMSLRDYFATAALRFFQPDYDERFMGPEDYDNIARGCYKVADALLNQRKK